MFARIVAITAVLAHQLDGPAAQMHMLRGEDITRHAPERSHGEEHSPRGNDRKNDTRHD